MSGATFEFKWADDNIAAVAAIVRSALMRGLVMAGEHILNVSNSQVPHEDGDLERSGVVTQSDPGDKTVAISYDTPYAVRQHEDLSLRHDAGRNAKFLSNACRSEAKTAGRIVANAVRSVVGN